MSDIVHLICLRCGQARECITPLIDELRAEIQRDTGFEIQVACFQVGGVCVACSAGRAAGREPPPKPAAGMAG